LGSAVYLGRWLPSARWVARRFEAQLRERPVWLFSSGPVTLSAIEADASPMHADALVERTGALHTITGSLGGALQVAAHARPLGPALAAARSAFLDGMTVAMGIAAVVVAAGMLLVLTALPNRAPKDGDRSPGA
jgi:hypothetical protein